MPAQCTLAQNAVASDKLEDALGLSDITVLNFGFKIALSRAKSIDDAGIKLGNRLSLPERNCYLEIKFSLVNGGGEETFRIPVYVGRNDSAGTELLFLDIEESAIAELRSRLRETFHGQFMVPDLI